MALEPMIWALNHSRSKLAARLVLIALANNAHHDGTDCYPSIAYIAEKANVSPSSVRTAIKDLVELGELEVTYNGGARGPNGTTNYYRIIMRDYPPKVTKRNRTRPGTPSESEPRQNLDPSKVLTPAESAPLQNSSQGVQILASGGPDSGGGTVLEPTRTKTSAALTLDGDPAPAAGAGSGGPSDDGGRDPVTGRYPRTAQGLVRWWIDEVRREKGLPEYVPPGRHLGHASRLLREMLEEGIAFDAVSRGLQLWWQSPRASSASLLPGFVNDVLSGNVTPMRESGRPRAGQSAEVQAPVTEREMIL